MRTYVIYDPKTGAIVQTHVQVGEHHAGVESVLEQARPGMHKEHLECMQVDTLAPGAAYKVDVKTKKLVTVEAANAKGAGGGAAHSRASDPKGVHTVYYPIAREKAE
jgi:hypothetical protein